MHDGLPACAQPLNRAYIQTITATQDVLALTLAEQVHPGEARYADRVESAEAHLQTQWQLLSQLLETVRLRDTKPWRIEKLSF